MTVADLPRSVWTALFAASFYEKDPGFRDVILRLSSKGMRVAGLIGFGCVLFYVGAYAFILELPLTWTYGVERPPGSIVLWDKLVVLLFSGLAILLARLPPGPSWGRLVVALMAAAVAAAFLLDDIAGGNLLNSYVYLVILMITVVGTMPYRPGQILGVCLGIIALYFMAAWIAPLQLGTDWTSGVTRRLVPMALVAIICTGISALIYRSRYEQYLVLRKAEDLAAQVQLQNEQIQLQSGRTQRQYEDLQAMERTKSRFFANVSHELRTPLTLILGPIKDALRGAHGPLHESLRTHLSLMERNGMRLRRLIDELLDLARLEAGEVELEAERGDVVGFTRSVVRSFAPLADRLDIDLQFNPDVERLDLPFDAKKLDRVLYNLLSNAMKFTPRDGKVRVSVSPAMADGVPAADIIVRDTGRGIPSEHVASVFDRFFQYGAGASHGQEGIGIGLSIAKEFAQLHGGDITVESEIGFGSTFRVRLPCAGPLSTQPVEPSSAAVDKGDPHAYASGSLLAGLEEASRQDEMIELEAGEAPDGAAHVLVVDDHEDMRQYLRTVLGGTYRVELAADGVEAIKRVRALPPALVICDVMMPEVDGLAVCRTLKSDPALNDVPIILLTAKADDGSKLDGLGVGADDYLVKPFDALELLARAENLIEIRRRLRLRFSGEVMIHGTEVTVSSSEARFLERLQSVVEAHLGNCNFGVAWLSDEMNLSSRQLQRRLKSSLGLSVAGYIQMLRLERAATLLAQEAGSVAEVAYGVGYRDVDHFSKVFRQTFGLPPSKYVSGKSGQALPV